MHHLAIGAREILREPWLAQDDDIDEGREHRESQPLKKPYRLSLLDCRNLSQGGQNLVRYLSIHVNDGNRPAKGDRKSTRLNSSHANISYAVFCLKKKKNKHTKHMKITLERKQND